MLADLRSATENLASSFLDFATGSTVWLAVTGLSRAGKTVFITSLIHNLLSAAHNPHRMPLLKVAGERRLLGAKLRGAGAHVLPRFPYQANIETMGSAPWTWPARTDGLSEIEIDIRFVPASAIGRLIGRLTGEAASLRLKLVDYPGEWLLDLPLLAQSYAEWSRGCLRHYRRGVRAEAGRDFLAFIAAHPHHADASEETARQAHDLYRGFLLAARDAHGLSHLQPGRFLCPGTLGAEPYLWFAPLDVPEGLEPAAGTLGALMAERYEVYKREVVEKFYHDHFRRYSRQIVLVDVLRALLAGAEAFEDTRLALEAICESFRYGRNSILGRLLGDTGIDRVLFAATKADHVPEIQREHLAALLRNMMALPALDVTSRNAGFEVEAIASVISTAEDTQEIEGQRVQLVVGRPVGGDRQVKLFVGTIPIRPPRPDAWNSPFLNVPVFEPPAIDPAPVEGIPHIRLDSALDYLIGDHLR